MKKQLALIQLILTSLVLILYPLVLIANIMSLAAEPAADSSLLLNLVSRTFLVITTLYPISLVIGWITFFVQRKRETIAPLVNLPLVHLVLSVILLAGWFMAERT